MNICLRDYQIEMKKHNMQKLEPGRNLCNVLPTGGGKTYLFGTILAEFPDYSLVAAHRQELVGQISNALARLGVVHNIISPIQTIKWIIQTHIKKYGRPYYDPQAKCSVSGVDTLLARLEKPYIKKLLKRVKLWVMDECHHILVNNKWGRIVSHLTHAAGLGFTATPERADGKGIGRPALGVFDDLIEGPGMRELINMGYLTDYRIICPPSDMNNALLKRSSATGDYTRKSTSLAVRKSTILGGIVDHYKIWGYGKRGVTFVPDVATAFEITEDYNKAGVPAETIHAGTKDQIRQETIERFEEGNLLQLVNVDIFGEGFDLPAVEVISMVRSTTSLPLYRQQFGRALRPLDGKTHGIIIDHVGNILNPVLGGPPDTPREWSLTGRNSKQREETVVKIKVCPQCMSVYPRYERMCPYCRYVSKPASRSAPEFVDGDLMELDPAVLARMRGEAERIANPDSYAAMMLRQAGAPPGAVLGAAKNHNLRRAAQQELREAIAIWGALQRKKGRNDSESYRKFYHTWGIDVMSAQTLNRKQAEELTEKIRREIKCL